MRKYKYEVGISLASILLISIAVTQALVRFRVDIGYPRGFLLLLLSVGYISYFTLKLVSRRRKRKMREQINNRPRYERPK